MPEGNRYTRKPENVRALQIDTGVTRMQIEAFCSANSVPLIEVNIGTPNGERNTDEIHWIVIRGVEFDHSDWIVIVEPNPDGPVQLSADVRRVADSLFPFVYDRATS